MFTKIAIFVICAGVFVAKAKPLQQMEYLKTCAVENGIILEADHLEGTPEQAVPAITCILKKGADILTNNEVAIYNALLVLLRANLIEDDAKNSTDKSAITENEPKRDNSNAEITKSINKRATKANKFRRPKMTYCYFNPVTCF